MSDTTNTHGQLIGIGLKDPFVRQIAAVAALASIGSFVISALGDGTKAVLTLALLLSFGVLFVILRTLMNNLDSGFVRQACIVATTVIMGIFLIFGVLLIPAATICWPPKYAAMLGLNNCPSSVKVDKPFEPIPLQGATYNIENGNLHVQVVYRPDRQAEAERIVGALRSTGYQADGSTSDLKELVPPFAGATVIRWNAALRPGVDNLSQLIRRAIPVTARTISVWPDPSTFSRGDAFQVDLF